METFLCLDKGGGYMHLSKLFELHIKRLDFIVCGLKINILKVTVSFQVRNHMNTLSWGKRIHLLCLYPNGTSIILEKPVDS